MFGLFQKARRKRTRPVPFNRIRLSLETLESRDCPSVTDVGSLLLAEPETSTILTLEATPTGNTAGDPVAPPPGDTAGDPVAPPPGDTAPPTNQAPTLTLNISYGTQRMVILTGQVLDENPDGLVINFGGVVSGSTVANADGTFWVELEASALGEIYGYTTDAFGLSSNTATVAVISDAPTITNMTCVEGINGIWTFRGYVTDESANGLTVYFAGLDSVANQTATVQADGWFTLIVTLQPGENGTVTAYTTDWWGQYSNTAYYIVRQT